MALYQLVNANFLTSVFASLLIVLADYLFPQKYAFWIVFLFPLLLIRPQHLCTFNIFTTAGMLSVSGILGYFTGVPDKADLSALINRIIFLSALWIIAYIQVRRGRVYFSQLQSIRDLSEREKLPGEREENLQQMKDEELLRKTMEELKRSNSDLERFASVISHDLQEPVRMISVYTGLLQRNLKAMPDEKTQQYMEFIKGTSLRMNDLIQGLLAYARVYHQAESITETDMGSVLCDVLKDLQLKITETKTHISYGKLPVVKANPLHMKQLFMNLISNAIKFRGEAEPMITIGAKDNGNEWLLSISDNGIGIKDEYLEKIFMVFNRLHSSGDKYPGNGIGLSICKKVVSIYGGRIWAESKPGEGSTFYFTIAREAPEG